MARVRALQEQQVERLGSGGRTIPVDVRVIAATNQGLAQMVEDRAFGADLYYRLNVLPITLPPLRERKEDIPLLVAHFVRKLGERQRKVIDHIPDDVMDALKHRPWPGNVRELLNVVERAVVSTIGRTLRLPNADPVTQASVTSVTTLADAERAHILAALRETNGVVGGWNGAAARLGVSRTTLIAKMPRLGLARQSSAQQARRSKRPASSARRDRPVSDGFDSEGAGRLN